MVYLMSSCSDNLTSKLTDPIQEFTRTFSKQDLSSLDQKQTEEYFEDSKSQEIEEQDLKFLSEYGFCKDDIYTSYLIKNYKQKVPRKKYRSRRSRRRWHKQVDQAALHYATSRLNPKSEIISASIPIVINPQVQFWINYFKTKGRHSFMKWLIRGESVKPILSEILSNQGMPQELFYLSMIESGFNNRAHSKAKAVGPWQFVSSTAKMYGLKINYWVDERKDPVKSTIAASMFLKDLYKRFGDWYLALAAYNAGPGKINSAIRRTGSRDFWVLSNSRYLKLETKQYVPKMLAALILGSNPKRHGFDVNPSQIELFPNQHAKANRPVKINEVAKLLNVNFKTIKQWNPELHQNITPPTKGKQKHYQIRMPKDLSSQFDSIEPLLSQIEIKDVLMHRIKYGDTLTKIARRYRISLRSLIKFNPKVSARALRIGKTVAVPVPSISSKKRNA